MTTWREQAEAEAAARRRLVGAIGRLPAGDPPGAARGIASGAAASVALVAIVVAVTIVGDVRRDVPVCPAEPSLPPAVARAGP